MKNDLYPKTVTELLRRWDAGQNIFTIELGGLGPGYEQAIQIAAVECARACKDLKGIKKDDKESTDRFRACCDARLHEIGGDLGLSGAQAGAAHWLAFQWCFCGGPKALIDRAHKEGKDDQVIQASKHFPKSDFQGGESSPASLATKTLRG